jgi:hypothetical protein
MTVIVYHRRMLLPTVSVCSFNTKVMPLTVLLTAPREFHGLTTAFRNG